MKRIFFAAVFVLPVSLLFAGAGKPTAKVIEETSDCWAFLVKTLGMNIAKASTAK